MNTSPNEHQSNHERRYPEDMYRRAATIDEAARSAVEILNMVINRTPERVRNVGSSAVDTASAAVAAPVQQSGLASEQARARVKYFLEHPEAINSGVADQVAAVEPARLQTAPELDALETARNLALSTDTLKTDLPENNPLFDLAA